jgi:uncharacterized protein (TIGR03086 family)
MGPPTMDPPLACPGRAPFGHLDCRVASGAGQESAGATGLSVETFSAVRCRPMTSPMGALEYLAIAAQEFRTRLCLVDGDDWSLATPCEGWSVRELASHVVAANQGVPSLLAGASREELSVLVGTDALGEDLIGAFDTSLATQAEAFGQSGVLERAGATAIGLTARQLLRFRTIDLLVHSWDLARTIGADEHLDAGLVAYTWQKVAPMMAGMATMGVFGDGPSGTLPEDAPLQTRLLDACGRRP